MTGTALSVKDIIDPPLRRYLHFVTCLYFVRAFLASCILSAGKLRLVTRKQDNEVAVAQKRSLDFFGSY